MVRAHRAVFVASYWRCPEIRILVATIAPMKRYLNCEVLTEQKLHDVVYIHQHIAPKNRVLLQLTSWLETKNSYCYRVQTNWAITWWYPTIIWLSQPHVKQKQRHSCIQETTLSYIHDLNMATDRRGGVKQIRWYASRIAQLNLSSNCHGQSTHGTERSHNKENGSSEAAAV
jgi:hypothetical protein